MEPSPSRCREKDRCTDGSDCNCPPPSPEPEHADQLGHVRVEGCRPELEAAEREEPSELARYEILTRHVSPIDENRDDRDLRSECGLDLESDVIVGSGEPLRPISLLDVLPARADQDEKESSGLDGIRDRVAELARSSLVDVEEHALLTDEIDETVPNPPCNASRIGSPVANEDGGNAHGDSGMAGRDGSGSEDYTGARGCGPSQSSRRPLDPRRLAA